jgi:hypothetical protein
MRRALPNGPGDEEALKTNENGVKSETRKTRTAKQIRRIEG